MPYALTFWLVGRLADVIASKESVFAFLFKGFFYLLWGGAFFVSLAALNALMDWFTK